MTASPRPGTIAFGAALVVASAALLLWWIPTKRPWGADDVRLVATNASHALGWRFKSTWYLPMFGIAALLGALGLAQMWSGATYRPRKEVLCRVCKRRVIGERFAGGVRCPVEDHVAEKRVVPTWLAVVAVVGNCVLFAAIGRQRMPLDWIDRTLAEGVQEIATGKLQIISFQLADAAEVAVDITVESGPAIDVYVIESDAIVAFRKREHFDFDATLSAESTRAVQRRGTLVPGRYAVLLDNTVQGKARAGTEGAATARYAVKKIGKPPASGY